MEYKNQRLHIPLEDPAKATGTEEEIMAKFAQVRDQIDKLVYEFMEGLNYLI